MSGAWANLMKNFSVATYLNFLVCYQLILASSALLYLRYAQEYTITGYLVTRAKLKFIKYRSTWYTFDFTTSMVLLVFYFLPSCALLIFASCKGWWNLEKWLRLNLNIYLEKHANLMVRTKKDKHSRYNFILL